MAEFNSKVDLRLPWMLNGSNESSKPHVDTVLHPDQRLNGHPRAIQSISPEMLQSVNLRKTGFQIDDPVKKLEAEAKNYSYEKLRPPVGPKPRINVFDYHIQSPCSSVVGPPPPPPPPPIFMKTSTSMRSDSLPITNNEFESYQQPSIPMRVDNNTHFSKAEATEKELNSLKAELTALQSMIVKLNEIKPVSPLKTTERPPAYESSKSYLESDQATVRNREGRDLTPADLEVKFNNDEVITNERMQKYLDQLVDDKFERVSRLDNPSRAEPSFDVEQKRRSRSRSRHDDHKDISRRNPSQSSRHRDKSHLSRQSSFESFKSATKSIRSVVFKNLEEEEVHSEIDSEDIADRNNGDIRLVDDLSKRFVIHGPFVDKELNVFHAICSEYQLAARISFSKRNPFSRTNPAHERVYALLGSNRRSSWTNMNSWDKAQNDLEVLDYLFKRTIRSKSRRIRKPVMELEHYREGSILDSHRFYSIMHAAFKKREHLVKVLGVNLDRFTDIK
jgi:hypothetical protein